MFFFNKFQKICSEFVDIVKKCSLVETKDIVKIKLFRRFLYCICLFSM